ncbi:MAG: teichoic acid D-Ala incorporation-associated protein DltX [Oscillospiraceae bacterium]|nr:teichoic acid D-Ala incorporation-associated protein DltX [Oscillospiraceae bacterium]
MKKLMRIITAISTSLFNNSILRVAFYLLVIAALVAVYLFTDGQKIEFVYNDF